MSSTWSADDERKLQEMLRKKEMAGLRASSSGSMNDSAKRRYTLSPASEEFDAARGG